MNTFIIIGAQKSATRWLRHNLGAHPQVHAHPQELKFFNHEKRYRLLGAGWYRGQLAHESDALVTGESTPGYLMWSHDPAAVAARVHETVPDARLVAILRDPVARAQSALTHHISQGRLHPRTRLVDVVRRRARADEWLGVISGGLYAASLEPYVQLFGDQLLIVLHDDIATGAADLYRHVCRHIGVSDDFVPASLDAAVHRTQAEARTRTAAATEAERVEVFEHLREDVARLERLLDRDLSAWDPAPRAA